jgi:hypothetical protein
MVFPSLLPLIFASMAGSSILAFIGGFFLGDFEARNELPHRDEVINRNNNNSNSVITQ